MLETFNQKSMKLVKIYKNKPNATPPLNHPIWEAITEENQFLFGKSSNGFAPTPSCIFKIL